MQTGYGVGATRLPQTQCSQGSHTQLQSTLPLCLSSNFPPNLCDWLLPQTEITINLIPQSNATPNVSAYAHLSGPFDYNKMPLAPMGCEAQVHKKTDKCGTWAYHLVNGGYLFTSPEHYPTHNCHIKHTKSEQLSNTVQFQHKCITNPSIMHANKVMQALAECVKAIQGMTGRDRNSHRTYNVSLMQHRLAYKQISANLKKPLPHTIFAKCNKFQGCRH
jgi:hypothetical protein